MNQNQHSFEAETIVDALAQVRNTLGPDAVILETRRVKRYPLFGLGGSRVRVIAGLQDNSVKRMAEMVSELRSLRCDINMISSRRQAVVQAARRKVKAPSRNPLADKAREAGLSDAGAKRLASLLGNAAPGTEELAGLLRAEIKTLDIFGEPGVTMLAGTTGVGKTTTLAKLAAGFTLSSDKSAALISKDAFRIGAMDQLKTYADLLGIPFESAFSTEDLAAAVEKHSDKYAVLVDTAGRSPSDAEQIAELGELADSVPGSRILLTISLAQARDAERIMESFAPLDPCGLVITKLDETGLQCGLLDILRVTGLPLAFTTSGQKVPEDLERADAGALAAKLALGLLEGF